MEWFSSFFIEGNSRLSLICNAHSLHILSGEVVALANFSQAGHDSLEYLLGVVLNPSRLSGNLFVLSLSDVEHFELLVDHKHSGRGRSLVNGKDTRVNFGREGLVSGAHVGNSRGQESCGGCDGESFLDLVVH